ncbi:MAG: response regulator transcription factor [Cytophagaceae bacterium]
MIKSSLHYYKTALKIIKKYTPENVLDREQFETLKNNPQFKALMSVFPGFIGILDLTSQSYIYISDNIKDFTSYSSEEYYQRGLELIISIFTEEHKLIIHDMVYPCIFEFIQKYSKSKDIRNLRCSFNYNITRRDGKVASMLQQMNIIHIDEQNKPMVVLYLVTEITEFRKDDGITLVISGKEINGLYQTLYCQSFNSNNSEKALTERELEILNLISQGKSSRQIAEFLCISIYTVFNHRKNMLKKMAVKSTGELLSKAIVKGMI